MSSVAAARIAAIVCARLRRVRRAAATLARRRRAVA
jgi:hypothetical protein